MADDIVYSVNIDDSKALAALKRLDKETDELAKDANKSFQKIDKGADKTAKTIGKLSGVTAGLTLAFAQLGQQAITAIADNISESIELAREQIASEQQLQAAIKSTGNASGLSAQQLKELASSLQSVTNFGDEATIRAEALLLTFKQIGGEVFPRALKSILDVSTAMGQDLQSSVLQIGKALNEPVEGLAALRRVGIQFTEAQEEQIETLTEAGDVVQAQTIILAELESQFGGSAEAAREADGGFQAASNAIGDLKEAIGTELLPSVQEYNEAVIKSAEGWTAAIKNVGLLADAIQIVSGLTEVEREEIEGIDAALLLVTDPVEALGIGFERIQKALEQAITPGANKLAQTIVESTVGAEKFAAALEEAADARDEIAEGGTAPIIDVDALEEGNEELDKALEKMKELEVDAFRKRIDIIRKNAQKATDIEKDFVQKRLDAARDYARQIDDIERKNAQAITDSATDLRRDEEDAYRDFNRSRADLERDSAKERIKIEENYREEIRRINQNFQDSADEAARQRDAVTFLRLQRERDRSIDEAKITRSKRVDEARIEASDKREELNRSLQEQLEDNRIADQRRLEDLQIRLEREFEAARINRERDLQDIALAEERKQQELQQSLDRQLQTAQIANNRRVSDFKGSLNEEVAAMLAAEEEKTAIAREQAAERSSIYQTEIDAAQAAPFSVPDYLRRPGRQHGGPVGAGQTVTVGERGPELFQPRVAGNVIPLGPGITSPLAATNISNVVNNTVNASVNQSMLDPSQQGAMMRAIAANVASETVKRIISG